MTDRVRTRQTAADTSNMKPGSVARADLNELARRLEFIRTRQTGRGKTDRGGLDRVTKVLGRSKAWWSQAAAKRWDKIKVTPADIEKVRILYVLTRDQDHYAAMDLADLMHLLTLHSEFVALLQKVIKQRRGRSKSSEEN